MVKRDTGNGKKQQDDEAEHGKIDVQPSGPVGGISFDTVHVDGRVRLI
jgi:hypothetical protein